MISAARPPVVLATTPERVALARRTHRSVARRAVVLYGVLAAVFAGASTFLALRSGGSPSGAFVVAGAFIVIGLLLRWRTMRILRVAERSLAADGVTVLAVHAAGLQVRDTVIPFKWITCLYAYDAGEIYEGAGLRGQMMAHRMGLTEEKPGIGSAIGLRIGHRMRRRLYREGAQSTLSTAIGVDRRSTLPAPDGMIDPLRTLPHRGEEPGRIDIPFGALRTSADLDRLLTAVRQATGGTLPIATITGTWNWAAATTIQAETRESIWEQHREITAVI